MNSRSFVGNPPVGVTFIAFIMFWGAMMKLLNQRLPWSFAFAALHIVLGIGLLKVSRWARVATIVFSILNASNFAMFAVRGFRYWHPMTLVIALIGLVFYVSIVIYLLTPTVRLEFVQPVRDA